MHVLAEAHIHTYSRKKWTHPKPSHILIPWRTTCLNLSVSWSCNPTHPFPTWCNITTQQRAFMETSFWCLSVLSCAGQQCFKEAVKYSSCFFFGAGVELRVKEATKRYKNRGLKKPHPFMMSIELPLNTAALSDFSFLFKG